MNCPQCQTPMREREKEAGSEVVLIDICPECGGIWLDSARLETLIRAGSSRQGSSRDDDDDDDRGISAGRNGDRRDRKGGFLSNFLDFGD